MSTPEQIIEMIEEYAQSFMGEHEELLEDAKHVVEQRQFIAHVVREMNSNFHGSVDEDYLRMMAEDYADDYARRGFRALGRSLRVRA